MTELADTRFRTDLVVASTRSGADGVKQVVVRDLRAGRSYRFDQREFFLCRNWNGTQSVEQIVQAFDQRFGARIKPSDVRAFLMGLASEDLLEPCPTLSEASAASASTAPYVWSVALPSKALFDLASIAHQFSWLGPVMLWASLPASFLATGTLLHNQRILNHDLSMLSAIPLTQMLAMHFGTMWGLQLAAIFLQALVLAYFGGQTTQLGLRLECGFLPVFESTMVNIERLTRREQLWVFGVPLLLRLIVTAAAVIVWFNARHSGSSLTQLAIFMAISSLLQLVTQGSPLWYRDGYFFLASYLRNPRLLPQSHLLWLMLIQRRPLPHLLAPMKAFWLGLLGLTSFVFSVILMIFLVLLFSHSVGQLLYGLLGKAGAPLALIVVSIVFVRFLATTYTQLTATLQ
ncbi:hypothetical protein [Synechococcus sp. CBW1004]|uniref:hypothetical protein n=1 Tax=Synechococcus sp. CBW1004 TaxID=1353136 RepID=UPI0018CD8C2A|nr:hypothetical protein [Synechococcus sp. CBW1004]QPN62150.1 hypothetical protein H8F25_10250 [Synechococcus sp. CBW1004]